MVTSQEMRTGHPSLPRGPTIKSMNSISFAMGASFQALDLCQNHTNILQTLNMMPKIHPIALGFVIASAMLTSTISGHPCHSDLDLIDLGYAKHTVSFVNTTQSNMNINVYKNIRFAKQPTGKYRFEKPQTPPSADPHVQDGMFDFDTRCVSAVPAGAGILLPGLNGTSFGTEDCLFLDVYVPKIICAHERVPVIHWLYGSGFAFGSKETAFTPIGIFDTLLAQDEPVIVVASNYRMGLYGFLASPFEDMQPNAGLWDALAALRWTQKHISKFGGDPSRVTAMGQSAGGGMIELLAASTGLQNLPFQRAFIASPALPLKRNVTERRQEVYEEVLQATNCTSLACLRDVNEVDLADVNKYLLNDVPSLSGGGNQGPGIGFGLVVDGEMITDLPIALPDLNQSLSRLSGLLTSNMGNEGAIVSSDQGMPEAFPGLVRCILPSVDKKTVEAIQSLYHYPPDHPEELAWHWTSDAVFTCHNIALANALPNRTRRYVMTIPPAWHALDMNYFCFNTNETTPVHDIAIAKGLQRTIGDFVYGKEQALEVSWPTYGGKSTFLNITSAGFLVDPMDVDELHRCEVINAAFIDPANGI